MTHIENDLSLVLVKLFGMSFFASRRSKRLTSWVAATGIAVLLPLSVVWGRRLQSREPRVKLGAAPFVGAWDVRPSLKLFPAIAVAILMVFWLPRFLAVNRFAISSWISGIALSLFTFALAAADGLSAVLAPVVHPTEYWTNLATLPGGRETVRSFTSYDFLVDRSVHLKGHPPGFILVLKGLAAVGLGRPWVTGALSFLGAILLVPAVAVTVKSLSGETVARRTLPFLATAPFALWLGTSADAFFSAVCAWGVAAVAVAVAHPRRWRRISIALLGGFLLGGGLFFSYGVVPLLILPGLLVLRHGSKNPRAVAETAAAAALSAAIVAGVFRALGFWWFDGLSLTRKFYWVGSAYFRTWTYFLVSNPAVLLIALGPAVAVGVWRLRDRSIWWVVGSSLLGVAAAEASQYSKGEVERIWLLFMPWIVPATSSLSQRSSNATVAATENTFSEQGAAVRSIRWWLALQVTIAVSLQATLRSKW